ncbi:hypothetical protein BOX15_Mlig031521g3 [Macrostomum lignano]|uniref:Uncharacterized protein n=2 Tax=Macrostomum lignano TaxID=282301 RepID=A0A267EF12_9PLAT|nr:hypothetical protein BOX15_Mlig031521g2 [Macrostomum lignano]PAA74185.1 hypothetical protein BOX15_Mlig031521g3 [Macrostomum lignano]
MYNRDRMSTTESLVIGPELPGPGPVSEKSDQALGQEYLSNGPVLLIVTVEYDRYIGRAVFLQLRKEIYQRLAGDGRHKQLLVTGLAGRYRSFEIRLQHKLVYSRLETRFYPDPKSIADAIQDALEGRPFLTCKPSESRELELAARPQVKKTDNKEADGKVVFEENIVDRESNV